VARHLSPSERYLISLILPFAAVKLSTKPSRR
jgi:hypothetical protein